MSITDPSEALTSFQQNLSEGRLSLQRGALDSELYVMLDGPNGVARFTYARIAGQTVTALVMFVLSEPIERLPCFNIGYAVPIAYRNQGRAKDVLLAGVAELRHGLARNGITSFYVEAIVGGDNQTSQKVAELLISNAPKSVTDQVSGLAAFHYLKKVE